MPPRKKLPPKEKRPRVARPTNYWHGGPDGLALGDMIIPAVELDTLPGFYGHPDYADADPARVYVTTNKLIAETYAAVYSDWTGGLRFRKPGAVYRVEPIGTLEEDPDYLGLGQYFSCARARILEVAKTGVKEASRRARLEGMSHRTWDLGEPMYDANGYGLPAAAARLLGVQPKHLRHLGFEPSPQAITIACSDVLTRRGYTQQDLDAKREQLLREPRSASRRH